MSFCSGSSHSELPTLETVTPKYWRETGQSDTLRHANSHAHTRWTHLSLVCEWAFLFCLLFYLQSRVLLWGRRAGLTVSSWARRLVSERRGRTMIRHEKLRCHLKQGHTERQLPPDTSASVPLAHWDGPGSSRGRTCAYDFWPACIYSHMTRITAR